jgi:hypothetical protein
MIPEESIFIFSEIVRCGVIGRIAYQTFHKYHNHKLHIYGRKEDFQFIENHPNNVYHYLDDEPEILEAFNHGHRGTSMVWTKVILEQKEKYIIHIDSDVVFRADAVEDVIAKLETHDIVGGMRNYPNNPHAHRNDVRHLPNVTTTYCFGFNREKIYVKEPHLLRRLVENSLDLPVAIELRMRYPQYEYVPTLDYFDPVAFLMIKEGSKVFIIDCDTFGGFANDGSKTNKYGILNKHMDFGDKIIHFASVGSGLNFLLMKERNETINVPSWHVDNALGKLDLYMRLFYDTEIIEQGENTFLEVEQPLREALGLKN